MKVVDCARSLSILPSSNNYNDVRPHHLVLGYAILGCLTSTKLYKKISGKVLNILSDLSEACIPLIHIGLVPDFVIRWGIRLQLRDHLNILASEGAQEELEKKLTIVQKLKTMPIAIATDEANDQHYEVPAKFYDLCLGPRKKYSSGFWPTKSTTFE